MAQTYRVLHQFDSGKYPAGSLLLANDGNFYGVTSLGGANGLGTIFVMNSSGEVTTLVDFNGANGSGPTGALVQAGDGRLYGVTSGGGKNGLGTVFSLTLDGSLNTLGNFDAKSGSAPAGGLTIGNDGLLYGANSAGGNYSAGTIFKVTTTGVLTTLYHFIIGPNPAVAPTLGSPVSPLVQGPDHRLYGVVGPSKSYPNGVIYVLSSILGIDVYALAALPAPISSLQDGLTSGPDGFYGTTTSGGSANQGTIFRVALNGTFTTLVNFAGSNGASPQSGLAFATDGNFYGTTSEGGAGYGTIFKMATDGTLTTLVNFPPGAANVIHRLTQDGNGNFYAISIYGGPNHRGAIFRATNTGAVTTLYSFSDGATSAGGLVQGNDGNFYGATTHDGPSGAGTAFKITPSGDLTTLADFGSAGESDPNAGFVEGSDGNFYGTTHYGGSGRYGTVFKLTPAGALSTLTNFYPNDPTGYAPLAGLALGADGAFYGTTSFGGSNNEGTVFKIFPNGKLTTLASIGEPSGGQYPYAALVSDGAGDFYGVTQGGQDANSGAIFELTSSGALQTLYHFPAGGLTPKTPMGRLLMFNGDFYGVTMNGGASGYGAAFRYSPGGAATTLASFSPASGTNPTAGLVRGPDGNFYGTTARGGNFGAGAIFRLQPDGTLLNLFSLDGKSQGSAPDQVIFGSDGQLYGTAGNVIYRLSLTSAAKITVGVAKSPSTRSAAIAGTVTPITQGTTVSIQYGLTSAYGSSVTAYQDNNYGPNGFYAVLNGLAPHALYHYTLSTSSSTGFTRGADATFTTLNTAPVAKSVKIPAPQLGVDTVIYRANGETTSDKDGDKVFITDVTSGSGVTGASGEITVSADGSEVHYVNPGFSGSRRYIIYFSDGFGGTTTAAVTVYTATVVTQPDAGLAPFGGSTAINVLANDSDSNSNALTITSVAAPQHGTAEIAGSQIIYTPTRGYVGTDIFTYKTSDEHGATGRESITVNVQPPTETVFQSIAAKGDALPAHESVRRSLPDDAKYRTFGSPAINNAAQIAYLASWSGGSGGSGIILDDPVTGSNLIAATGQAAPDAHGSTTTGFTFVSFETPVLYEDGGVAFQATLAGPGVTPANDHGIFIAELGVVMLVARTGDRVLIGDIGHGLGHYGEFKSFKSIAVTTRLPSPPNANPSIADRVVFWNDDESIKVDLNTAAASTFWDATILLVEATLVGRDAQPGPGGITSATNLGVWALSPGSAAAPVVQTGATSALGEAKRIKGFRMLQAAEGSPGQYRFLSALSNSYLVTQVTYRDGSEAILGPEMLSTGRSPSGLPGARFRAFGLPALGRNNSNALAYRADLVDGIGGVTATTDNAIFTGSGEVVARSGTPAPDLNGVIFDSFLAPLCNSDAEVAFLAVLRDRGISPRPHQALFLRTHDLSTSARPLEQVAQAGGSAPGIEGAVFKSFESVALPDLPGTLRLYFVAKLATPPAGRPNPLRITERNNTGLWAQDSQGVLRLILRTGDPLPTSGNASKILQSFTILSAVAGSTGQARSFNDQGALVFNAFFTDGSQAIMTAQIP